MFERGHIAKPSPSTAKNAIPAAAYSPTRLFWGIVIGSASCTVSTDVAVSLRLKSCGLGAAKAGG
jgi:hypothetical protein